MSPYQTSTADEAKPNTALPSLPASAKTAPMKTQGFQYGVFNRESIDLAADEWTEIALGSPPSTPPTSHSPKSADSSRESRSALRADYRQLIDQRPKNAFELYLWEKGVGDVKKQENDGVMEQAVRLGKKVGWGIWWLFDDES